jgi:hypothetical protein
MPGGDRPSDGGFNAYWSGQHSRRGCALPERCRRHGTVEFRNIRLFRVDGFRIHEFRIQLGFDELGFVRDILAGSPLPGGPGQFGAVGKFGDRPERIAESGQFRPVERLGDGATGLAIDHRSDNPRVDVRHDGSAPIRHQHDHSLRYENDWQHGGAHVDDAAADRSPAVDYTGQGQAADGCELLGQHRYGDPGDRSSL